jgi:hypothetical protein
MHLILKSKIDFFAVIFSQFNHKASTNSLSKTLQGADTGGHKALSRLPNAP